MTPRLVPVIVMFAGCSLLAAGGIGEDAAAVAPEVAASEVKPAPVSGAALRGRALENFIRASLNPKADAKQRIDWLFASLEADPASQSAMALLDNLMRDNPPLMPDVAKRFFELAWNHPEQPALTIQCFSLIGQYGVNPGNMEALLNRTINYRGDAERSADNDLALCRLLEIKSSFDFECGKDGVECSELFRHFLADDEFMAKDALNRSAARHFHFAARRADRDRRWLGLRQSPRAALEQERDELLAGIIAGDSGISEPQALENLAFYYLSVQRPEEAIRIASRLAAQEKNSAEARLVQARVFYFARKYRDALVLTQSLLSNAPENAELLQLEGEAALRCGRFDVAANAGKRMLKINPKDAIGRYLEVAGLVYGNKLDEATIVVKALEPGDERDSLEMLLAMRQRNYKTYLEKLRGLEKKLGDKTPDGVYLNMLVIAEKSRDPKLLDEAWKKLDAMGALEDYDNANSVGYVAAELGVRLDEAETLIRKALKAEPDSGAYLDSLAWLEYRKGELKQSFDTIREALNAPMDSSLGRGTLLIHAGEIADKLGDRKAAKQYYEEALGSFDDPDIDIDDLQKRIKELESVK
ncbi:MAG: hypothetical protein AB7F32_00670 [Victivallaceae bacterium]